MATLSAGAKFGAYEIIGLIAQGGMGAVYRARARDGRQVALKTLAEQYVNDTSMRARFEKEPRLAPLHPNIVRILDAGEIDGVPFFAMDLVEGRGLDEILRERGPYAPADFFPILSDVAAAIDGAHYSGVVHRDIKPSNIMLRNSDQRVVLTDFGIAKRTAGAGAPADQATTNATQAGAVVGTVRYMSPEQALGKPVTSASDVYSLGALVYEMLCGAPPFQAENAFALMRMHIQDTPRDLHELRRDISPAIAAVVQKAMAKSIPDRYPSAGEFARAFFTALREGQPEPAASIETRVMGGGTAAAMAAHTGSAIPPGAGLRPAAKGGTRWLLPVLGAVVVVLGLAIGSVWYFGVSRASPAASGPVASAIPTVEGAPRLVSPAPNTVFSTFPRNTVFQWQAIPGATSYIVEVDCLNCCEQGKWCADVIPPKSAKRAATTTTATVEFFGAQPGRWRVSAVLANGQEGPKSEWWPFSYTR